MSPPSETTLTRILHPCVLIEGEAARVLFDPCFGFFARRAVTRRLTGISMPEPGIRPEALGNLTVIAMTHAHEDHFDERGMARIPSRGALVIVPTAAQASRVRKLGFPRVEILAAWESASGPGWSLTAAPARAPNARIEISYVLRLGDLAILHAGDTATHPRFGEIRDRCAPAVGCLPVSGVSFSGIRLTMTPAEAARAAALLDLSIAVPIHAEMRFGRLSALAYRAKGTEEAFAEAVSLLAPGTRALPAPRGLAVPLRAALAEAAPLRYPRST